MKEQFLEALKAFSESEKGRLNRSLVREFGSLIFRIYQDRDTERQVALIVNGTEILEREDKREKKSYEVFVRNPATDPDKKKMIPHTTSRPAAVNTIQPPVTSDVNLDGKPSNKVAEIKIDPIPVLAEWEVDADNASEYSECSVEDFEAKVGGWERIKDLAAALGLSKKASKLSLTVSIQKVIKDAFTQNQ